MEACRLTYPPVLCCCKYRATTTGLTSRLCLAIDLCDGSVVDRLSGTIGEFAPNKNIIQWNINGNPLSGSMPASISEMDGLIVLTLSETSLSGSMPSSIGMLSNLRHSLYMSTLFSGEAIPEYFVLCDL